MVCIICNHRPAKDGGICADCRNKIEAETRKRQAEQPVKFATYRGHVIGFYRNGSDKLDVRLLRRSPDNLPRTNTINLDTYVEGMTRDQVKKIKSAILQLANA